MSFSSIDIKFFNSHGETSETAVQVNSKVLRLLLLRRVCHL